MNIKYLLMIISASILFSCSSEEPDTGPDLSEVIIGGWQLEKIKVVGADCKANYGDNVPEEYLADEKGCAVALEVLGNASRCTNLDLRANGMGTFLWSEINGTTDAEITYTVTDNEFEYCFDGTTCSGFFKLVDNNLELELGLIDDCSVVYVLTPK